MTHGGHGSRPSLQRVEKGRIQLKGVFENKKMCLEACRYHPRYATACEWEINKNKCFMHTLPVSIPNKIQFIELGYFYATSILS